MQLNHPRYKNDTITLQSISSRTAPQDIFWIYGDVATEIKQHRTQAYIFPSLIVQNETTRCERTGGLSTTVQGWKNGQVRLTSRSIYQSFLNNAPWYWISQVGKSVLHAYGQPPSSAHSSLPTSPTLELITRWTFLVFKKQHTSREQTDMNKTNQKTCIPQ